MEEREISIKYRAIALGESGLLYNLTEYPYYRWETAGDIAWFASLSKLQEVATKTDLFVGDKEAILRIHIIKKSETVEKTIEVGGSGE